VVGGVGEDVRAARAAAAKEFGRANRYGVGAERREILDAGRGCGEQTTDELGAAVGDEAKFGGVVLVLGTQDAWNVEEIAVETKGGEEVSGIMSETAGFGEGGRWLGGGMRGWRRYEDWRRRERRGWGQG
jgi:hypothetical protein